MRNMMMIDASGFEHYLSHLKGERGVQNTHVKCEGEIRTTEIIPGEKGQKHCF